MIAGSHDEFLQYADDRSAASCKTALLDLERLVNEEGPFDGVIAFSQGAALAASLIVHKTRQLRNAPPSSPGFRCAIFFSGGVPMDPSILSESKTTFRPLSYEADGVVIEIPTAHIWGTNDDVYPTFGPVLSKLCKRDNRAEFIHSGGHDIPGPKNQEEVLKAVHAIKRTIERADTVQ